MKLSKGVLQIGLLTLIFTLPLMANAAQQTPVGCQWIADPDGDIICV